MENTFLEEVARWREPDTPPLSRSEASAYCADLARQHYENFPVVTMFLPRHLHQHFYNVYAFCRWSDDLGDETGDSAESVELLRWWRGELCDCFAGQSRHPVFVALRETIERFHIPIDPFTNLISAFEQDQHVLEYDTLDQLEDYCRRSANPVGELVLRMAECLTPQTRIWSDAICTGLQLANFWQDVARDADIGRIYLPRADRQRYGYTDSALNSRLTNSAFNALMQAEVERARHWLLLGQPLIHAVPRWLEVEIDLFIQGGLQILKEIERMQFSVWDRRPVVTKWTMTKLFVGSMCRWVKRRIVFT